jgi:hypothetical protein
MKNFQAKYLRIFISLLLLFQNYCSVSQNFEIDKLQLNAQIDSAIQFILNSQKKNTIIGKSYAGEWPVDMHLTSPYFFIGKKQKAEDSNCFTISAIYNALAEVYMLDSSRKVLLPSLLLASKEIRSYGFHNQFNFWKKLKPTRNLKLAFEPSPQPFVHRPTNFHLKSRFINNTGNVPEDADDTSLGNLSLLYENKIFGTKNSIASWEVFDNYLDINRKNRNWFNVLFHSDANSGAFMTWLHPEFEYNKWNPIKTAINTLLIFVPGSTARPEPYEPWVPFGANDIDVVVNANVLSYLSKSNQLQKSKGHVKAIALIENRLKKKNWFNNSVYYPNQFHIHSSVTKAYASGILDLKKSAEIILEDIFQKQKEDGRFESQSFINNRDVVQSTANALSAMLDCKKMGLNVPDSKIENAIKFLLSQKKTNNNEIHWDAGVYFSGGTLLRNILFWKSEAYTTSAIINCFERYLKGEKDHL